MAWKFRGSGVRHTLPFVGRFAGLWLIVTIAAVLVAAASTYMVIAERAPAAVAANVGRALLLQTVFTIVGVVALAVFTTHRLAGPWIAVRRALEQVRDGNYENRLRIRANDVYIRNVENAFNEMLDALKGGGRGGTTAS